MTTRSPRIPRLHKLREAASILSVSAHTLRDLTAAGKIKCIKVTAKAIRYSEDELREYIAKGGAV